MRSNITIDLLSRGLHEYSVRDTSRLALHNSTQQQFTKSLTRNM